MSNLFWRAEAQMAPRRPYLSKIHGRPCVGGRRVQNGIIAVSRNDLRWCDAPGEYGPPKTLYNRWNMGVFARIMEGFRNFGRGRS